MRMREKKYGVWMNSRCDAGSNDDRLSVYCEPSLTDAAPLMVSVGATLFTVTLTVLPAANVPSSSVAVALIV